MKRIGMTLGKYAPLHKGHEFVINTMLDEMDEGIVIIYDTDVTPIPLAVRKNWIQKLYPNVIVIEAWNSPVGEPYDLEYEKAEEEYIKKLLDGISLSAFYCSEYYGEHISRALGCDDRRVDVSRTQYPISATQIRDNPYKYRQYVDELVYRDLIVKIVFLGAMSTGKTTITEALAKRYNTTFADEYGRHYWTEHQVDRRINIEAFNTIAVEHIKCENEAIKDANKYFFVDTNAITTYMYSLDYHGKAPSLLTKIAEENATRYNVFFLCDDDIPYDDTWDRSGDAKRHVFQKQIIDDLNRRGITYTVLSGSLEERILKVETVLKNL